jgi:hypothetical protein
MEYSDPKETRFSIKVEQGVSYLDGTEKAWVYFSTSDFSEVPQMHIDGKPIPSWYLSYIGYSGETGPIEPKTQYEFEIIKNTIKSSGLIEMPAPPINIRINGVLLTGVNDSIPANTSYNITWDCNKYDYFYFSSAGETYDSLFEKSFQLDTNSVIHGHLSFSIKTKMGKSNINDSNPNYLGDYGKGYIFSSVNKSFSARVVY